MLHTIKVLCFLFVIAGVFNSCTSKEEQVKVIPIGGSWMSKPALEFSFDVQNAQQPKNIIFVVRNNNEYPYANLRLFVSIIEKDTKKTLEKDTLNYLLAKPNGDWLGSGFGVTKEILLQYKSNFHFPKEGKYIIELNHAMRKNPLVGIEDIGIKINKVKP